MYAVNTLLFRAIFCREAKFNAAVESKTKSFTGFGRWQCF
jgi:hypothetical protein